MKNDNDLFYRWMKKNLSYSPESNIDKIILATAEKKLKQAQPPSALSQWLKPGLAMAFGITLVIVTMTHFNHQTEMKIPAIAESPEMVLHYHDIELMADAGALTEEDWKKVEGIR